MRPKSGVKKQKNNMKRFSEQFHKKSESVTLQPVERAELRSRVVSYMEYHPMAAATPVVKKRSFIRSPYGNEAFKTVPIPTAMILRWSVALSALILIIIPVLAEQTLPGDNLYAVKVRFNEELRSTLTFDQRDKITWETERLNRRIAEARLLASEGKLTDEVSAQVVASVREHTDNVQQEINTLRETDADGATFATIELSTTLELQSESLQQEGNTVLASAVADASVSNTTSTQALVDVLNESISKQDAQTDDAAVPGYDKIMARVEQNTTRSYELLTSAKFSDNDPLKAAIDRRLQDVSRSIEEANGLRSEDETGASKKLIGTLERTQKLIVFMSDIKVNRGVDLETVVPAILTNEEKEQQLAQVNIEINHKIEILETLHPKLNAATAAKVDFSIQNAKQKQTEIKADKDKLTNHDFVKDTMALLDDALKVIAASGVSLTVADTLPTDNNSSTSASTTKSKNN